MPLNIASVLSFIPTNLWRQLKKFVTKDTLIVFDIPFKLSTKYTPALLIVMMCLSFANQFVRNIEIDCSYGGSTGAAAGRGGGYGGQQGGGDTELNDFCWNHDTFLVAKALKPDMRGLVTYPGVSGYDRGKDQVVRQRYYKQVWLILGKMAILAFLPYFLWKLRGAEKMRSLIDVVETDENTEDEMRVTYFLETLGFNDGFALYYLACKMLAGITPILTWVYLTGFMGRTYKIYGWDVLTHFMDEADNWPNPMDALFPKMAKCEWARYGHGGDVELKSAQCQLPMNNLTQWSFFLFWWWSLVVFFVNSISCVRLLFLWMCRPYRRIQYRSFVQKACRQDVEKARTYTVHTIGGQFLTRRYRKSDIVMVQLSFGDWLVLSFLKRNLADWQFREFIKKLVVTENTALQLKPMPSVVIDHDDRLSVLPKGGKGDKGEKGGVGGGEFNLSVDDVDGKDGPSMASTPAPPPMGFIYPPHHHPPSLPSYSACGTNDCDDEISPTSTPHNGLQGGDDDDSSIGNTSVTMLCRGQTTINITPPVKINRALMRQQHNQGGGGSSQQQQSSSGGGRQQQGYQHQAPTAPSGKTRRT